MKKEVFENKAKGSLKFIRITPMKANRVAKLIRKQSANEAIRILKFSTLAASLPIRKLLNSVLAIYKSKYNKESIDDVFIVEVLVNQGPTYKRMRPRARGMGARILKRNCHIEITVGEKVVKENENTPKKDVKRVENKKEDKKEKDKNSKKDDKKQDAQQSDKKEKKDSKNKTSKKSIKSSKASDKKSQAKKVDKKSQAKKASKKGDKK